MPSCRGLQGEGLERGNRMTQCVACGEKIQEFGNHHCSPEAEKRRQTADKLREQDYELRKPTEAMRLNYGFHLLSLSGS